MEGGPEALGTGREDGLDLPAPGLFTKDAKTIARVKAQDAPREV